MIYSIWKSGNGNGLASGVAIVAFTPSHRRGCHFADAPSPSVLKRQLKEYGVAAEWQSRRRLFIHSAREALLREEMLPRLARCQRRQIAHSAGDVGRGDRAGVHALAEHVARRDLPGVRIVREIEPQRAVDRQADTSDMACMMKGSIELRSLMMDSIAASERLP